jgi:TPR repeat protein
VYHAIVLVPVSVARRMLVLLVAALLCCATAAASAQSLSEARELVDARRFHAAVTELTELLQANSLPSVELARAYSLRGESQRQRNRFAEARADFQRALELDANLAGAAFGMGLAERYGWGGAPNPGRARDLLRQAADAGIAAAAMELANIYLSATPAQAGPGLAALQRAANLGLAEAMFNMGELHVAGLFVSADPIEAFRWHLQAAEAGHGGAMYRVSTAYRDGNGVSANPALAESWLQRSIEQGYGEALHFAGYRFASQGDLIRANRDYLRAAQAGLVRSQINLGVSYMTGNRGVQQDFRKAYYWYSRATGAGFADYYRGVLLEHGRGVEVDLPAAYAAYEAASATGLPQATAQVALLLDLGRGVTPNRERAAAYFAQFSGSESPEELNGVAWVLATHPAATVDHGRIARKLALRATTLTPDPSILDTLAAAHAASGEFSEAVSVQERAMRAVNDAALLAEFEAHLGRYRAGERWIDDVAVVESSAGTKPDFPEETVVFTGEVIGVTQGTPDNSGVCMDLDPGDSRWGVVVRVSRVEAGRLPQHLQDLAVFYLHSPTELLAQPNGNASFLAPPQGEQRFTLVTKQLDYELTLDAVSAR